MSNDGTIRGIAEDIRAALVNTRAAAAALDGFDPNERETGSTSGYVEQAIGMLEAAAAKWTHATLTLKAGGSIDTLDQYPLGHHTKTVLRRAGIVNKRQIQHELPRIREIAGMGPQAVKEVYALLRRKDPRRADEGRRLAQAQRLAEQLGWNTEGRVGSYRLVTAQRLLAAGFTTKTKVERASDEELLAVYGVGPAVLADIRAGGL
jgi:hypothetical protein